MGTLFNSRALDQLLHSVVQKMHQEIESLDENRILNTSCENLESYFAEKYRMDPITLLRDQYYANHCEVKIDVRNDQMRSINDRSYPCMVPGERFEVRIPFSGDSELFHARANEFSLNPLRAVIENNELLLHYDTPSDQPEDIRPRVDRAIVEIERHLGWQREMIDAHNNSLQNRVEQVVQQRRERILARAERAEALGIPIRRREDAPKTYAVPTVRRKVLPTLLPITTASFKPEPVLEMELYDEALKIVQNMALVIERSPVAFKTMDEEALRQHFLVQLNGQFEGKSTGETFNMGGKTDILLREGDKNLFIAECKFWKGPKAFAKAIDQLLSYTTWRDSKTAILVFNRGVEMSTTLSRMDEVAKKHGNFNRVVNWPHESGFRYVFHSNGDTNKELTLTVLAFHVPT